MLIVDSEWYYTIFETVAGWIGLVTSPRGLALATLPQNSRGAVESSLNEKTREATYSSDRFKDLIEKFRAYFQGDLVNFNEGLDLSGGTSFQRAVWQSTQTIPYGETRSYGWIASQISRSEASRGVGQALGKNPLPIIIPCHRVIGSDGKLHGFGGGIEMKKYLLKLENRN